MRRMLPMPWKTLAAPHGDKEYVALLSFLPLKHYRTVPKFFWLTFRRNDNCKSLRG
jgi:hypothetical protein